MTPPRQTVPGRVPVTFGDRTLPVDEWRMTHGFPPLPPAPRPPLPGGWRGFLLFFLPPPRSRIEFWDDEDTAEVVWTPVRLAILLGDLPHVRFFFRPEDGEWFDRETGEVPNRWLRGRLEEEWKERKGRRP